MNVALAVVALPPALALGSFLNVVAARLPEGRSLLSPPSSCGGCGTRIAWRDNVPVLSYLLLRGRCRACGAPFSPRYLAVELLTAALVAACFLRFGLTADAFVAALFVSVLVVLSAIDVERRILPDKIVLPSAALVLGAHIALYPDRAVEWLAASLGASLFLFLALLADPRGMGMGDVKLAFSLGLYLGWLGWGQVFLGGFLAFLLGAGVGVTLIATKIKGRKDVVPFGPFLALGAMLTILWGDPILRWYTGA